MRRIPVVYMPPDVSVWYSCHNCDTHIAAQRDLESRHFHGRRGKAYLFTRAYVMSQPMLTELSVNYSEGSEENRVLMTGLHSVRDVFCIGCEDVLGWKYVVAFEDSQKYKEGKIVLERPALRRHDFVPNCLQGVPCTVLPGCEGPLLGLEQESPSEDFG